MDKPAFSLFRSSKNGMESKGLNDFAKHALQEICQQEWVREKFLKDVDHLFTSDLLIDPMLSNKQVICCWGLALFKTLGQDQGLSEFSWRGAGGCNGVSEEGEDVCDKGTSSREHV